VKKLGQWEVAGKSIWAAPQMRPLTGRCVAFERAVLTTKSFIIALALVKGRIDVEQAAQAAHVEVVSQTMRWGEVEDSK
jgi:chaperone required for assembly of F1-ATPase